MKKIISVFLIVYSFNSQAQNVSTKGTEFWLTYMENLSLNWNAFPAFTIIISSDVATSGVISIPATGFTIGFIVNTNIATEITLPQNIYYPQGDEDYFNFGIKITSQAPVNVYTYHHREYFTDASIVLPVTELSDQYLITAHTDDSHVSPSEFVVEATQDSTVVEITPSVVTLSFRPPDVPFNILLNKGQVFQLQSYNDLTGTRVKSLDPQKKIAVFGGARQASISCTMADNTLYDQVYPETSAGTSFITTLFLTSVNAFGYDVYRFMATMDSTSVSINSYVILILKRGQYYDTLLTTPAYITSDKPIFATQFKPSQSCFGGFGDPSMLNLTPVNLKKRKAVFQSVTDTFPIGNVTDHYLNIITSANATGALKLDGSVVTSFQAVPSNPSYSYAAISILPGSHILESDSGFNAYAYGAGTYNAYTFHLGYDNFLPTAIDDPGKNEMELFVTNPVKDKIRVTGNQFTGNIQIKLYTLPGQILFEKVFRNATATIEIDVSGFSKGIYLLEAISENGRTVKKIVKQ